MPIDIEQLLEMFDNDPTKTELNKTGRPKQKLKPRKTKKNCNHEFIPLFNSISCKFCGLDQDKK
jgi:hypothetical protein